MPNCVVLASRHSPVSSVSGPVEILSLAAQLANRSDWQFQIVSEDLSRTPSSAGLTLAGSGLFADTDDIDLLIIPALGDPRRQSHIASDATLNKVAELHKQGTLIATTCSGAWVPAAAGILDGLPCTSHWLITDWLIEQFPQCQWQKDAMLTRSENLWCGGGGSAWQDVSLALVQHLFGNDIAQQAAQLVLIDQDRNDQRRYHGFIPERQHQDHLVHQVQDWLADHASESFSIADLAQQVSLSERQFKRRFTDAVKLSPRQYVQSLRMSAAKKLLQTTRQQVDKIARDCGYEDVRFFRQLFRRDTGLTPLAYREKMSAAQNR